MVDILYDQEIEHLIKEKKPLPKDYLSKIQKAVFCLISDGIILANER